MKTQKRALAPMAMSALLAAALAGCGGGGGGGDSTAGTQRQDNPVTAAPIGSPTIPGGTDPATVITLPGTTTAPSAPTTTTPSPTTPTSDAPAAGTGSGLAVACSNCAAVDARTYAGSGVGVWQKSNTSGGVLDVPVSISGLSGQEVTLVFTNEGAGDLAFPAISTGSQYVPESRSQVGAPTADDPQSRIREFNRKGWADRIAEARANPAVARSLAAGAPSPAIYAVGATRTFNHEDQSVRSATLQKQLKASDGTVVNVWVETSEIGAGKVTTAISDQLATSFARSGGIYDMLKSAGGALWGAHNLPDMISGTGQPLDIVVLNFDRNQAPYGWLGYFWSLHQMRKSVDSRSNESLSMYVDSETLYLGGDRGAKMIQMTLAHEGMHMANFYRRGVTMGQSYQYDTWLEEMTAMMMEDAAAANIDPTYNPTRDMRLQDYLSYGSYNCALKNWTPFAGTCESYAINGSFGGFLLRQLGVDFYRNLLNQKQAGSEADLQAAIQAAKPGSGIGEQLRRFAASAVATLPASAPAQFGFPARTEGGFQIPAIDASAFAARRTLPATSPASLAAYANFPAVRRGITGTFSETVRVPAGATLSVVIH